MSLSIKKCLNMQPDVTSVAISTYLKIQLENSRKPISFGLRLFPHLKLLGQTSWDLSQSVILE